MAEPTATSVPVGTACQPPGRSCLPMFARLAAATLLPPMLWQWQPMGRPAPGAVRDTPHSNSHRRTSSSCGCTCPRARTAGRRWPTAPPMSGACCCHPSSGEWYCSRQLECCVGVLLQPLEPCPNVSAVGPCPTSCPCPFPAIARSLAEAQAYARWAGGRLLTEAEYELTLSRADQSSLAMSSPAATAGSSPYTSAAAGEAASAAASRAGTTGSGQSAVCQLESGGWEWTATPLHPLPGGCVH